MDEKQDLIETLENIKDILPKKQRTLCEYVLTDPLSVGTLTVADLAQKAGVAATTVLRLIEKLRYEGYGQFKRDLFEAAMKKQNDMYVPLQRSFSNASYENRLPLAAVCDSAIECCTMIASEKNEKQFTAAVDLIMRSERVYLLGLRSAASLSMYFHDALGLFMKNIELLSFRQEFLFDHVLNMTPHDVVVVISTWPCTRRTVEFANLCQKYNVPMILITNSSFNPIASFSEHVINTGSVNQASEHISTLIVVQAFVEELGKRHSPQSAQRLNMLNDFFKANQLVVLTERKS